MRTTSKLLVMVMLLAFCNVAAAQNTFNDAQKAYNDKHKAKDYAAALDMAKKCLELSTNNDQKASAYTLIAREYNTLKQFDESIKAIDAAEALEGLSPRRMSHLHWTKAQVYYGNKKYELAREYFKKVNENEATTPTTRTSCVLLIANTYSQGDPSDVAKARQLLESVKDLPYANDMYKAEAVYSLSLLDRADKKYDDAIAKIQSILNTPDIRDSVRFKYQMALADNYRMAGLSDKAVAAYQDMLKDEKGNQYVHTRAQLMIGITYLQSKDNAKAREAFQAVVNMKNGYPSYVKSAKVYLEGLEK